MEYKQLKKNLKKTTNKHTEKLKTLMNISRKIWFTQRKDYTYYAEIEHACTFSTKIFFNFLAYRKICPPEIDPVILERDKSSKSFEEIVSLIKNNEDNDKNQLDVIISGDYSFGKYYSLNKNAIVVNLTEREYWLYLSTIQLKKLTIQLQYTQNMAIIYLFSILEQFLKEFMKIVYLHQPKAIATGTEGDKKLDYREILTSQKTATEIIIDNEIDLIGRKSFDWFAKKVEKRYNITISNFNGWKTLLEGYHRRNIIVHNANIVNEDFFNLIEEKETMMGKPIEIGKPIEVSETVCEQIYLTIFDFFLFLEEIFLMKFKPTNIN